MELNEIHASFVRCEHPRQLLRHERLAGPRRSVEDRLTLVAEEPLDLSQLARVDHEVAGQVLRVCDFRGFVRLDVVVRHLVPAIARECRLLVVWKVDVIGIQLHNRPQDGLRVQPVS